jgi:hypothetical protein
MWEVYFNTCSGIFNHVAIRLATSWPQLWLKKGVPSETRLSVNFENVINLGTVETI